MSSESPEPSPPSAPGGIPVTVPPASYVNLSRTWLTAAVAVELLYAAVCVVAVFVLNSRVSLANRVLQGDTSVTEDQAHAADNNVSAIVTLLIIAFVLLLIAGILWERNFNKVLGRPTARRLQRRYGLQAAWIVWLVLWLAGTVTQNGATPSDPQALINSDHRSMLMLGARAALLVAIAVLTLITDRRAQQQPQTNPVEQVFAAPLG